MPIVMSLLHGDENCASVQPLINFEKESVLHFNGSKYAFGSFFFVSPNLVLEQLLKVTLAYRVSEVLLL